MDATGPDRAGPEAVGPEAVGLEAAGLDALLEETGFQGVALVRAGGRLLLEAARGEARPGVPATLDTRYDSADVTKLVTAVTVLREVQRGALDLELSIHHYLPVLAGSRIPVAVSLLQLLTHTSGIADIADEGAGESYEELFARRSGAGIVQTADWLPFFVDAEPLAAPGSTVAYCDAGYVLAGLVVEAVTARPFRDQAARAVLAPAGMRDSGFLDRRDDPPRLAIGGDPADPAWRALWDAAPPLGGPAEGLFATAGDLLRLLDAVVGGRLLDAELTEELLLPQVHADEDTALGFGLTFDLDAGAVRSFRADGVGLGASAMLRRYPREDVDVVVLSNDADGAWELVRELDERI
ncbi:MAG: serine hydrolase domain-containing protein [Microbacteriaceae bacterium]